VVFEREVGLELLVATARLWRSLGHHDSAGEFRIDGVTGPDEYTAIVDNNVYTNLMAQANLRAAADTAARHARAAAKLGVNAEEMASWRDAAKSMRIPFDEVLGVHPQAEGFGQGLEGQGHRGRRVHADRMGLLVARAGLVGAMVGGTALFARLITVIG
jgi:alpha,alpha-trehalose phosphorylase